MNIESKKLYKLPSTNGVYCGFFVTEDLAQNIYDINLKWCEEIRSILEENKETLLPQEWTGYFDNGENGTIRGSKCVDYYDVDEPNNLYIDNRINLFKPKLPEETVVYFCDREKAKEIARIMYEHEKTTYEVL